MWALQRDELRPAILSAAVDAGCAELAATSSRKACSWRQFGQLGKFGQFGHQKSALFGQLAIRPNGQRTVWPVRAFGS